MGLLLLLLPRTTTTVSGECLVSLLLREFVLLFSPPFTTAIKVKALLPSAAFAIDEIAKRGEKREGKKFFSLPHIRMRELEFGLIFGFLSIFCSDHVRGLSSLLSGSLTSSPRDRLSKKVRTKYFFLFPPEAILVEEQEQSCGRSKCKRGIDQRIVKGANKIAAKNPSLTHLGCPVFPPDHSCNLHS